MKNISLKEKVGQLFICKTPDDIDQIEKFINEGIGGFMIGKGGEIVSENQGALEGDSLKSLKRFVKLLNKLSQKNKKIPLFLAIDGEGGKYFNRLKSISDYKSPRFYGKKFEKDWDLEFFKKEVEKFAKLMNQIGFNMNFAPPVGCAKKGYKGYLAGKKVLIKKRGLTKSESMAANRSYSDKRETVSLLGLTAMQIFQKHNIIPTLKHFPSYGILDIYQNPHIVLPKSKLSRDEISAQLNVYKLAFEYGCYAIMKGWEITCLDRAAPALLSIKVDEFLKKKLKFDGLTVTDELHMGAMKRYYPKLTSEEALKKTCINALIVNDILLSSHPDDFIVMRDAIIKKANKNKKYLKLVNEAYNKVLHYKKVINLL